jgi:hypothetical protein
MRHVRTAFSIVKLNLIKYSSNKLGMLEVTIFYPSRFRARQVMPVAKSILCDTRRHPHDHISRLEHKSSDLNQTGNKHFNGVPAVTRIH